MSRRIPTPILAMILIIDLAGAAALVQKAVADMRAPVPIRATERRVTRFTTTVLPPLPPAVPPVQRFGGARAQGHLVNVPSASSQPFGGASRPVSYSAIGASDAAGVGADDPATQNWVADLSRFLPTGSTVLNLGVPGILTAGALQRELPRAVNSHPDLVTVWLAVNDINARVPLKVYSHQLSVLLKTLHTRTHAAVFVGNVPALGLLPSYQAVAGDILNTLIAQWNVAISRIASRYGATVVDLYTPSLTTLPAHPEYVSADGFHPSTLGYLDEARTFWQVIRAHRSHLSLP